jgi:hypothetical protein
MSVKRVSMLRLQDLVRLHRLSISHRKIAQLLKMSRNTVKLYTELLSQASILDGNPDDLPNPLSIRQATESFLPAPHSNPQPSSIEQYLPQVATLIERGVGPKAIFDLFTLEEADFSGSYSAVKRMARRLKANQEVKAEDVAIPVESKPGLLAQVDFGHVGKLYARVLFE